MYLAVAWLLSMVMAETYYEIVLAYDHDTVFVMTDKVIGFTKRNTIPWGSTRSHVTIENSSIKIGDRFVCRSLQSDLAELCVTAAGFGGKFGQAFIGGHTILTQDNDLVLARGATDMNNDFITALITDMNKTAVTDYHMDILEYKDGRLTTINPPILLHPKP